MNAFDMYCRLDGALDGSVLCSERMARHTTYCIGGPADLFIECASTGDIALATSALSDEGMAWAAIGKGSNLLVSDDGCRSAVITLGKEFKSCEMLPDGMLAAGAGMALSAIVQRAFKEGIAGYEFCVGIPGTLGGAIFMNAGSREEWIGSLVESLTVYTPGEGLSKISGRDIEWDYRHSGLPRDMIILEAVLRCKPGDVASIRSKMEARLSLRKRTQPLSYPSAGSVFRNPTGRSAGQLIEDVGLKGTRVGGAQISEMHANFIVNMGDATAADVIALITLARKRVEEVHGIRLKPEIQFLGF